MDLSNLQEFLEFLRKQKNYGQDFLAQLFGQYDQIQGSGNTWNDTDRRTDINPGDVRSTNPNAHTSDDPRWQGPGNWDVPNSYIGGGVPLHGKSLDQMPDLNQYGGGGGNDTRYYNFR